MDFSSQRYRAISIVLFGIIVGAALWLWLGARKPNGPSDEQLRNADSTRATWEAFDKINALYGGLDAQHHRRFDESNFATVQSGLRNPDRRVRAIAISVLGSIADKEGQQRAITLLRPLSSNPDCREMVRSDLEHYMTTDNGRALVPELVDDADPALSQLAKEVLNARKERANDSGRRTR